MARGTQDNFSLPVIPFYGPMQFVSVSGVMGADDTLTLCDIRTKGIIHGGSLSLEPADWTKSIVVNLNIDGTDTRHFDQPLQVGGIVRDGESWPFIPDSFDYDLVKAVYRIVPELTFGENFTLILTGPHADASEGTLFLYWSEYV